MWLVWFDHVLVFFNQPYFIQSAQCAKYPVATGGVSLVLQCYAKVLPIVGYNGRSDSGPAGTLAVAAEPASSPTFFCPSLKSKQKKMHCHPMEGGINQKQLSNQGNTTTTYS